MIDQPTAKTIRLHCDGELPDDEAREVERHLQRHPAAARGLAFERTLRERVGAVLRESALPDGLAERVRAAVAEGDGPQPATASRAWWRSPNRANLFAVAASLALVVGAVLFGILGPQIDELRARAAPHLIVETAAAAAGEHVMAATSGVPPGATGANAPDGGLEDTSRVLAPFLDPSSKIIDLSDLGYEFASGHTCHLPNCEPGCHLFYRRADGKPGLVSLYVVPDHGQCAGLGDAFAGELPLPTGVVPESRGCQKDVLVWSYGGRTYLLVICIAHDLRGVVQRVQESLVGTGEPARR
jgi:anti-sigma factor RsiW